MKKNVIGAAAKTIRTRRAKTGAAGAGKRKKAEHGSSVLNAFQEIRELIVRGNMSPGMWIVEADLAERLNMSRTPVRTAIHWLQREGYVLEHRSVSKSRMIVAPLTKEDANELYVIIGRVEGIAGRSAAQFPAAARETLVRELRVINNQLLDIATGHSGRPGDIFELDRNFHRTVLLAGAGARLATLHAAIEPQAERYWRLYASSIINDLKISVDEHAEIIEGLEAGNADRVESGLQKNWWMGAQRLAHVIDMFGERGSW